MRILFNLVCSVSLILGIAAFAGWVRSYYAADHLTLRRPFGPTGERVAAQLKSELGGVTFTYGTERVDLPDLPKLQWDAWTKPGLKHRQKPLSPAHPRSAREEALAKPQPLVATARPSQTQPTAANAQPAAAAIPAVQHLYTFSHTEDPRKGVVRVGKQHVSVSAERTTTVFPHWALALALFVLPAIRYSYRAAPAHRSRHGGPRPSRSNSYDAWASRTPPERRRQLPLTRIG